MADEQSTMPTRPLTEDEATERIERDETDAPAGAPEDVATPDASSDDAGADAAEAEAAETDAAADEPADAAEADAPAGITATMPYPSPIEAPGRVADEQGSSPDAEDSPQEEPLPDDADDEADEPGLFARLKAHRWRVLVAVLACAALVAGGVALFMRLSQAPADDLVKADARERLAAPSHTTGAYDSDDPLVFDSLDVVRKQPSNARRDAYEVSAVATFSSTCLRTQADATLTYVREGDEWTCTAATVSQGAHHATAGVSQQKTLEHTDELLAAADSSLTDGGESLVNLYRDATVTVVDDVFDEEAQTDTLTLHLSKAAAFVSYECNVEASFRFAPASGSWELAGAKASDTARDLGFQPLMGTWRGTFQSQTSRTGKCLSARDVGLTVEVRRATMTAEGATIEGAVSGIAHLHPDSDDDVAATDGDVLLDKVPFTGATPTASDDELLSLLAGTSKSDGGIVFECATQDNPDGNVSLTLQFGSSSAPDAATATLASTHSYEDMFLMLVPYEREARYVDSFSLERAD